MDDGALDDGVPDDGVLNEDAAPDGLSATRGLSCPSTL